MKEEILRVVVGLIESGGTDAVQLRTVAKRARVSLTTIYKHFATRDELIVAALERWMAANCYAGLSPPPPGESVYDGLMRVFRHVFEPWERSPRLLEAYHRARTGPLGALPVGPGVAAVEPVAQAVLAGLDPDYAADIGLILTHMSYAVIGRFADGELDVTEILPTLERAVYRLTADNAPAAARAGRPPAVRDGLRLSARESGGSPAR